MKNQRIRVKTRPAPPRRAPTFGPAAALVQLHRHDGSRRRRRHRGVVRGKRPTRRFFLDVFFRRRERVSRASVVFLPRREPGNRREPAGTKKRTFPFGTGPIGRRSGSGGRAGEPYGYLVRTRTETRARRRDRRGGPPPYDATARGGASGETRSVGPKSSGSSRDTNGFVSTRRASRTNGVRVGSKCLDRSFFSSRSFGPSVWVSASEESTRASSALF